MRTLGLDRVSLSLSARRFTPFVTGTFEASYDTIMRHMTDSRRTSSRYNPCLSVEIKAFVGSYGKNTFGTMCKSLRSNYVEGGEARNRGPGEV